MVKEGEEQQAGERFAHNPLSVQLPEAKPLVALPMPIIIYMFDMSQWRLEGVIDMLKYLKMADEQIKFVESIINQVEKMGVFGYRQSIIR
jgi:hypothetical protein